MEFRKQKYILHFSHGFGGGLRTVISNLINDQLRNGHRVGVVYPVRQNEYDQSFLRDFSGRIDSYPIEMTIRKGLSQLMGLPIKDIYERVKRENPDYSVILHAHNTVAVGLSRDISGLPLLCTLHGVSTRKSRISEYITLKIIDKILQSGGLVNGVSLQTASYYNNLLGSPNVLTVVNGIEVEPKQGSFIPNKFTIGYLAYLNDLKGWRFLFDAYASLEGHYQERIDLVFAGIGPDREVKALEALIEDNKLSGKVRYLGYIENAGNTLTPYLSLVVLPSASEGLGLTLVEAIANGVPILATRVGGIPEVLVDGENGYFIERNPLDIANKIKRVFDDEPLRKSMGDRGIEKYLNEFTVDRMGEEYMKIYSRLSDRRHGV